MIAAGEKAARVAKRPVVIEKDSFLIGLDNLSEGKKKRMRDWKTFGNGKVSERCPLRRRESQRHTQREIKNYYFNVGCFFVT